MFDLARVAILVQLICVSLAWGASPPPDLVVYLHGSGGRITAGTTDDALANVSSTVRAAGHERVDVPPFEGTAEEWHAMRACAQRQFAGLPVVLVDRRPASEHLLVMIGGRSFDPAWPAVWGLATTTTGVVVERGVGFVFSAAHETTTRAHELCMTLAHEIGHLLGLPHSNECADIMGVPRDCTRVGFLARSRAALSATLAKWGREVVLPMPARVSGIVGEPLADTRLQPTFHAPAQDPRFTMPAPQWPVTVRAPKPVARALLHVVTPSKLRGEYHCLPDGAGCRVNGHDIDGAYPMFERGEWHMLVEVFYADGEVRRTPWYSTTLRDGGP